MLDKMIKDNKLSKIYKMANMLTRFNCAIHIKYLFAKSDIQYPASSIQHLTSKLQKKGQALVFVLFILAVFGALAGGLAVMWESEIRTRDLDRDGLIAFYLAQAGIENAKIWAKNNPGTLSFSNPWVSLGGGWYNFTVADPGIPNSRTLNSTGQVQDASGNIIAERQLNVQVQGIGAPPESQTPWTWREI